MTKQNKTSNESKNTNFDKLVGIIKQATGKPLQSVIIPLELFEYAGNVQKAVFLARLLYLSDKGHKPNGFVWKSYPDWKKEVGLSQDQIERVVEDLKDKRHIIETKKMMAGRKNGNASNTWHYRLLVGKFLADFKNFLLVRSRSKSKFQPEESAASITVSTNINTAENTLLGDNVLNQERKNQEKENVNLNYTEDSLTFDLDYLEDYTSADDAAEAERVALPSDFKPSLQSRIWAITKYPYKSVDFVTDKFVTFYTTGKGSHTRKTTSDWEAEWRNWVVTEKSFGANKEAIGDENWKHNSDLCFAIYGFIADSRTYLVPYKEIIEEFCERRGFSEDTITEHFTYCERAEVVDRYFDCYYLLDQYKNDQKCREGIDQEMYDQTWKEEYEYRVPRGIFEYIQTNLAVTEQELKSKFIGEYNGHYHKSISHLLRVCEKFQTLTKTGDFYHEVFFNIAASVDFDNSLCDDRIEKIKVKLEEVGATNPVIEEG